jgi:hypothetical protein
VSPRVAGRTSTTCACSSSQSGSCVRCNGHARSQAARAHSLVCTGSVPAVRADRACPSYTAPVGSPLFERDRAVLIATRVIVPGDELYFDYGRSCHTPACQARLPSPPAPKPAVTPAKPACLPAVRMHVVMAPARTRLCRIALPLESLVGLRIRLCTASLCIPHCCAQPRVKGVTPLRRPAVSAFPSVGTCFRRPYGLWRPQGCIGRTLNPRFVASRCALLQERVGCSVTI